jgi:hypothetical protein
MATKDSAKSRYEALTIRRDPFLRRARDCAKLTIPSILPPEGHKYSDGLSQPFQGLGARGVVSLSSRLTTALVPPGMNLMRLMVPAELLAQSGEDKVPQDLDTLLARSEDMIQGEIERRQWRNAINIITQHLIVTGNVLIFVLPNNRIRLFRLDQFAVVRDPSGNLTEFVTCEKLSPVTLGEKLMALTKSSQAARDAATEVCLYTWGKLDGNKWTVHQELEDVEVPNSRGSYDKDELPFYPLRWAHLLGEDYGRGKIEEHFADIMTLDGLTKSVIEGAAMASRNIMLVRPNAAGGLGLVKRLTSARNGSALTGFVEDVNMLQFQNVTGMQFVAAELQRVAQDLAGAFMLNSAMRRDAERVTAFELRTMIEEIEGTLGSIYSTLSVEMMGPMLNRLILQMQRNRQLPQWPKNSVEPVVLTGLEALGREKDVQKVITAAQLAAQFPPEVADYVDWPAMLSKAFNGLGIPGAVRTEAEAQAARDRRAASEAMVRAAPNAVNAATAQPPQQ